MTLDWDAIMANVYADPMLRRKDPLNPDRWDDEEDDDEEPS